MPQSQGPEISSALIRKTELQISKALARLEYSLKKTAHLSTAVDSLSDLDLEAWEGLLSRFARAADLYLSKYLRMRILHEEPGFRGSTRDLLNLASKLKLIQAPEPWLAIKELRNRQAHDYEDEDLSGLFEAVRRESVALLGIRASLPSHSDGK